VSAGQLRKHEQLRSRFLRNNRDLIVYVPPGYDDQPFTRYPILYMQDGQNLFDRATSFGGQDWNVHGAADHMIGIGAVRPLIIVGIYNTGKSRVHEYTPIKSPKLGGGRADRYAKFLIEEVMPFIQREYRVNGDPRVTGIGGSSLGGLLALYLGLKHPQMFGKIAALSPSVWWHQSMIMQFAASVMLRLPQRKRSIFRLRSSKPGPEAPRPRIWLDIGTKEGPRIVPDVERFRDILLQKGWREGEDLHYERVEGGEHNELAWSQRIGRVLQFLYPAPLAGSINGR
jgi:predicted alpha/beta superfamily hydrolase